MATISLFWEQKHGLSQLKKLSNLTIYLLYICDKVNPSSYMGTERDASTSNASPKCLLANMWVMKSLEG